MPIGPLMLAAASAAAPLPTITFVHSGLIERYCATLSPDKPDPRVVDEIDAMLPAFRAAWAARGPQLMAAAVALTGQPYRFRETVATLHGCRDMPSYSAPFLLAAGQFTRTGASLPPVATAGLQLDRGRVAAVPVSAGPPPLTGFAYLAWHESTHRYIGDILATLPGGTTPLLTKYAGEDAVVRAHLHLFALERLVYERLGLQADYAERTARLRQRNFASAVRAVDIVDQEGAAAFVAELRPR